MNSYHGEQVEQRPGKLISPRFFPGQLLTNEDLTALKEWARTRFALLRPRDGWGVVCGLDVQPCPDRADALRVTPGYAVDYPGNDVLLMEATCAAIPPRSDRGPDACAYLEPSTGGQEGTLYAGPYELGLGKLAVYDLMLYFHGEETEPVAAFRPKGGSRCEATRVIESGRLEFVRVPWDQVEELTGKTEEPFDPVRDDVVGFLDQFANEQGFGTIFEGVVPDPGTAKKVRDWLVARVNDDLRLARTFPTLTRWLGESGAEYLQKPGGVAGVLFWLVDALRRQPPLCDDRCPGPKGVRLARVWAKLVAGAYEIRFSDTAPPVRQVMPDDDAQDWLARTQVGRTWEDTQRRLARLGIPAISEVFHIPQSGKVLRDEILGKEPVALTPGEPVVVLVSEREQPEALPSTPPNVKPLAGRVVAIRKGDTAQLPLTLPGANLDVTLLKVPRGTEPSEKVEWAADPGSAEELKADAIPTHGWVRVKIAPSGIGQVPDTKPTLHNGITKRVLDLPPVEDGKVILATFPVPAGVPDGSEVEFTLLLQDPRRPSQVGAIRGKATKRITSAPVSAIPTLLAAAPVAPGDTPGSTPRELALCGNLSVPLELRAANPTLSAIIVELREASDDPRPGDLRTAGKRVGNDALTLARETSVVIEWPLSQPKANHYFWLANGLDDFHRSITVPPSEPSILSFVQTDLKVTIVAITGTPIAHQLKVKNDSDKSISLTRLMVTRKDGAAPEKFIDPTTPTQLEPTKDAGPFTLSTAGTATEWTVWIDLVREGKKLTGVANVVPTVPPST